MVHVNKSVWRGREQDPKTVNAIRVVDLAPSLTDVLKTYVDKQQRKSNLLFQSSNGSFLSQRNLLRDSLHPAAKELGRKFGFHVFRRFRESVLLASDARQILIDYWMGHSNQEMKMSTRYGQQLLKDADYRKEWAERVGLGFQLPASVVQRVQLAEENFSDEVAA
jgi:integrase